jgi:hypothetical protein
MQKICILVFTAYFTLSASAQKKSNPKVGKNEWEITSFILTDDYLAFGGQFVYRFSWKTNTKIGAGGLCAADYDDIDFINVSAYGAAFADIMQFIGHRQKWSFGGQIGHGFSNREIFGTRLKAGIYYSISGNFRAIVSKRLLFTTSLFIGYRNFHYKSGTTSFLENNPGLSGLRVGIVF